MKAIVCNGFAPVEQLEYRDVTDPAPAAGELLVDVRAASVNYLDGLIVQGQYQVRPATPFTPGAEVTGVVSGLGTGVTGFRAGERIMAATVLGGFAEKLTIPASSVMKLPDSISDEAAAGLIIGHGTALHALKQRAQLRAGETLAVSGAAGGTGLAAVQVGKVLGARVIAICSSEEKLRAAKENGADVLIDSSKDDLRSQLKAATDSRGVDVAYDTVGGEVFDALSRSMAWGGRLLVIGFASGRIPQFPVNLALVKGFSVVGVFYGQFTQRQPADAAENARELLAWHEQGRIQVQIDSVLPLAEAVRGIQRLMSREAVGKVILKP